MNKLIPRLKPAMALMLAATLLLSLTSCFSNSIVIDNVSTVNEISVSETDSTLHFCKTENALYTPVYDSGLLKLYLNEDTYSFNVVDVNGDMCWGALPISDGSRIAANASMVTLKVFDGSDIYILNSQENSVAFDTASYEVTNNGISFKYDMFIDRETAEKSSLSVTDVAFSVKETIAVFDSTMYLTVTAENLSENPNASVCSIEPLNYFGAYNDAQSDDFIYLPDGCGAIIKTGLYTDDKFSVNIPVYGDVSNPDSASALIPVWGIKHGDAAVMALITDGDAVADIIADKAISKTDYNHCSARFTVRDYSINKTDKKLYIAPKDAVNSIGITYRFLSGQNASYPGLACACREQLIREGDISPETLEDNQYLPFCLSLIGSVCDNSDLFSKSIICTDFEQATDMLTRMKNKGINSVNIRYLGTFTGSSMQKNAKHIKVQASLGDVSKLQDLYDYVNIQNMKLFLDVNLTSASQPLLTKPAINVSGSKLKIKADNEYKNLLGKSSYDLLYRSVSDILKSTSAVYSYSLGLPVSGLCLADVGKYTYGDYSQKSSGRQDYTTTVYDAITSLSSGRSIMISRGNLYTLKNADIVVDMPIDTHYKNSVIYSPVPFVQIILHGIMDYSSLPLNLENNQKTAMLRCIEYGACPCYEWSYTAINENDKLYSYNDGINDAATYYTDANNMLGNLRGQRISDHIEIADGIFKTEYDNGSIIYVNYTEKDFTVSGAVVPATGYTRVN